MNEKIDVLNELGEFTGDVATIDECHSTGYWHRAVYAFIVDKDLNVLLQKRSGNKKLWPGKWCFPNKKILRNSPCLPACKQKNIATRLRDTT